MANVVVIDDRVTNRNILTRLAKSVEEGVQVTAFADPLQALAQLDAGLLPDLVVTDFSMPGMDGATLIGALRERERLADIPVIVVTSYEDREYRYRALSAGATDFLQSPLDHSEFRARARNLLTMRRQQRLLAERAAFLEQALRARGGDGVDAAIAALLDTLPVAIMAVDARGKVLSLNSSGEALYGIRRDQAVGQTLHEALGETYATKHGVLNEKVVDTALPMASPRLEMLEAADGQRATVFAKAPAIDASGRVRAIYTAALDISDVRRVEQAGAGGGLIDPLTGLPGIDSFRERVEQELSRARRQSELVALLHLDLDRYKGLNDAFGEPFGDALLRAVALRLKDRLGEHDVMARLRSDEFVVMHPGVRRADDATDLCRRLGEAFGEPWLIDGQEVHLSASIGVTLFPTDGKTVDTLLKNADLAMYRAKASGRDAYRFFAAEMNVAARRAVTLERELRLALAADQFLLYYQPQLALDSGRLVGVEALVRWNHPERGIVRPGEFIGLAEDIGLIQPLTKWVLRTACRQLHGWLQRGFRGMQMSVNLSPIQFRERGVELMIEGILAETGLPPALLDIELTENAVIENSQTATASLRYLHQLGVTLSIDDFGTGYSSLSYVKRLPVQRLKIDQSFVQNVEHSANDEVIVRAIINLGHSLGLKVIAEGVETEGQLARLRRYGCDEAQGNLISPPVSAEALEPLLRGGPAGLR
ncbi:MAG: EAL domain-containing protein [Geminicoccaceae bacterium]